MLLKPIKYKYVNKYGLYKLIRHYKYNVGCSACMYKNYTCCCIDFPCGKFDIDLFTYIPVSVIKEI